MKYQANHHTRFDSQVRIAGLTARGKPRRRLPISDGIVRDPHRQTPSSAKPGVVLPPVLHPELELRDMTAAFYAVVIRHG